MSSWILATMILWTVHCENTIIWWRDGSAVKSTFCSSTGISTHIMWLTNTCNFSTRESDVLFCPLGTQILILNEIKGKMLFAYSIDERTLLFLHCKEVSYLQNDLRTGFLYRQIIKTAIKGLKVQ